MNRQQRRQLSRRDTGATGPGSAQGPSAHDPLEGQVDEALTAQIDADREGDRIAADVLAPTRHRIGPRQFLHEVNSEMRKVAWPSSAETINYSAVVLITLVLLVALVFTLDLVFTKFAGFLFNP
jgi:preprotein translocase SecE subunit